MLLNIDVNATCEIDTVYMYHICKICVWCMYDMYDMCMMFVWCMYDMYIVYVYSMCMICMIYVLYVYNTCMIYVWYDTDNNDNDKNIDDNGCNHE